MDAHPVQRRSRGLPRPQSCAPPHHLNAHVAAGTRGHSPEPSGNARSRTAAAGNVESFRHPIRSAERHVLDLIS